MLDGAAQLPECLIGAYSALGAGSAIVGCVAREGGVLTLHGSATLGDLRRSEHARYTLEEFPPRGRAAFLLAGLLHMENEVCG